MSYIGQRPDSFGYTSTSYDHFSGNNSQTVYTLSRSVTANGDIFVTVANVPQDPGVAYFVTNLNTLTFTSPPPSGTNNIVVVYRGMVQSGIAPAANTVTAQQIAANTIQAYHLSNSLLNPITNIFTGDGSTVNFTLSQSAVSSNACFVTVNGITQAFPSNYSVNGTTLTFTSAPSVGAVIRCVQNSIVGTSIVPIDGSVTNSKLASNLTLTGNTTTSNLVVNGTLSANIANTAIVGNIISSQLANNLTLTGNTIHTGFVSANNGLYSSNNFTGTYTDGIVVDYVNGNGRISVGPGDGLTIFNGGVGNNNIVYIDASGKLALGAPTANVSLDVSSKTDAIGNPGGTTAQRPSNPVNGYTRYNTTTGTWEAYNNGGWSALNSNVVTNYQQFTSTGTFTVPTGVRNVQVLIVGGGGGGGSVGAGGGGGGGVIFLSNYSVTPGAGIAVTVGAGGAAASNGTASQFDGHHIAWGGGGGPPLTDHSFGQVGGPLMGASGGGAGATSTQIGTPAPGSSQGSAGGWAPTTSPYPAGGGGGAGSVGGNGSGSTNGAGGTGVYSQIFSSYGQSGWFGGGGGGGYTGSTAGAAGLGGGGTGSTGGTVNTGGGGAGLYSSGTSGGSGTVIVAWYQ